MKVLITGANGFVGSRILRRLTDADVPTVVLLRPSSDCGLIADLLPGVEVKRGSLDDDASLVAALAGVTHVVHAAGKTKALRPEEFDAANVQVTRRLLEAVNRSSLPIARLVHLSSLGAVGPAIDSAPAREHDPPRPVSAYGRSKLRGEEEVRATCRSPWVILRPPGVYGPGDRDFLQLFKAARAGVCPLFGGGRQALSLVYVDDLASVVLECLTRDLSPTEVLHVAHPQTVTARELTMAVAREVGSRPVRLPLPVVALTPLAAVGELWGRLRGRPAILSLERRRELQAPGWVCDTTRLRKLLGPLCHTPLTEGLRRALSWYRERGWLR